MNIWTWNVNSIRSRINEVNELLNKYNIDVLFITETKISSKHESDMTNKLDTNYKVLWNSNVKSYYHGTAFVYKKNLSLELLSMKLFRFVPHFDMELCKLKNCDKMISSIKDTQSMTSDVETAHLTEGRIITIKINNNENKNNHTKELILVGTYVPNSGVDRNNPLKRLAYRTLVWDKDVYMYLNSLKQQYKNVIWLGDLNVARLDNDINNPRANYAGTTPEERSNMNSFINSGWIDTWDVYNFSKIKYVERWTYGNNKSTKLRLDYVICSENLKDCVKWSVSDQGFGTSDHIPIGTFFDV